MRRGGGTAVAGQGGQGKEGQEDRLNGRGRGRRGRERYGSQIAKRPSKCW